MSLLIFAISEEGPASREVPVSAMALHPPLQYDPEPPATATLTWMIQIRALKCVMRDIFLNLFNRHLSDELVVLVTSFWNDVKLFILDFKMVLDN